MVLESESRRRTHGGGAWAALAPFAVAATFFAMGLTLSGCGEEPTTSDGSSGGSDSGSDASNSDTDSKADASFSGGDSGGPLPDAGEAECQTNKDCSESLTDLSPCERALCNAAQGLCVVVTVSNFTPCDDGNACTVGSACVGGSCAGGQNIVCQDGNPCTDDSCDGEQGCTFTPNSNPCDDGNPCTNGDGCVAGLCQSGASSCPCTVGADCAQHDDGNACNGKLYCTTSGFCELVPGSVVICEGESVGCLEQACLPENGQCVTVPRADGSACTDGNACTTGDACLGGSCIGDGELACPGGGPCLSVECDPELGCKSKMLTGACDDGNACTSNDSCVNGQCVGVDNACACQTAADCADQDDQNACNGVVTCIDGFCNVAPGSIVTCPAPSTPCATNDCQPETGQCVESTKANGSLCSDGDPCTTSDTCVAGVCQGVVVAGCGGCVDSAECNDNNPCTTDACMANGQCVYTDIPNCTVECSEAADCEDDNPCTTNTCAATNECEFIANTGPCDDGNLCTSNDTCSGGVCVAGVPLVCNDGNPCTADVCHPTNGCEAPLIAGCCAQDADCDDGYPCTKDKCNGSSCSHTVTTCPDAGACTLSYCGPSGQCVSVPSTAVTSPIVLLTETFDDGVANAWTITSNNEDTTFSVQSQRANSQPSALYVGKPGAWSYDFGVSNLSAALPKLHLPQGKLTLRFNYWADLDEDTCQADILFVGINGTGLQPFVCASTEGGFGSREYDISAFAGQAGFITLFFQTYDVHDNAGEGIYIDDFTILAEPSDACP